MSGRNVPCEPLCHLAGEIRKQMAVEQLLGLCSAGGAVVPPLQVDCGHPVCLISHVQVEVVQVLLQNGVGAVVEKHDG
jgi:hypothetical protein